MDYFMTNFNSNSVLYMPNLVSQYEETKEGVMDDNRRTLLQFI